MTSQEINERFAKLAGICWHKFSHYDNTLIAICTCGKHYHAYDHVINNPDFSDPREVLRVMKKRDDWDVFAYRCLSKGMSTKTREIVYSIPVDYITIPGKLRDVWIEWMEKE